MFDLCVDKRNESETCRAGFSLHRIVSYNKTDEAWHKQHVNGMNDVQFIFFIGSILTIKALYIITVKKSDAESKANTYVTCALYA